MKRELEQDTLEIPALGDNVKTNRSMELIKVKLMDKEDGVVFSRPPCDHGDIPCGPENHSGSGHGYCRNCYLCN